MTGKEGLFTADDIISTYTREQAIDDGVLVDVSEVAREAGIKYPVAVTQAVWSEVVEPDDKAKEHGESIQGRLWDVLWMLLAAIKAGMDGDTVRYYLIATKDGKQHKQELRAVCGPGDTMEPVITIMMPDED